MKKSTYVSYYIMSFSKFHIYIPHMHSYDTPRRCGRRPLALSSPLVDHVDHVVDEGLRAHGAVEVLVLGDQEAELHGRREDRAQGEHDAADSVADLPQRAVEARGQDVVQHPGEV